MSVAKTALWIAEEQMMEATQEVLLTPFDFLPLKSNGNIRQGNALKLDWNEILPAECCAYVVGNPPFYGARNQSKEQKAELAEVFHGAKRLFHHASPDALAQELNPRNINAYLADAPDAFVWNRSKPLCNVPKIGFGSQPIDGGSYLFKPEEREAFLLKEPGAAPFFHPWLGSDEFIKGKQRFVLWLGDATPE